MAKTFEEQFYIFLNQQKKLLADLQAIIENGITANVPEPLEVTIDDYTPVQTNVVDTVGLTDTELRATPVQVFTIGVISEENSTTTPLNAGGTFTGEWVDVLAYPSITVSVKADQDATWYLQLSPDGTNVDSALTRYYRTTQIEPPHRFSRTRRYARVVFTNTSASNQTYLRIQTILGDAAELNIPTDSTIAQDYDAKVTRPTDYKYEVALGRRQGSTTWNKFGYNDNVSIGTEVIASFGGTFTPLTSASTLTIVSSSANDDGAPAGTGANSIIIYGVGDNWQAQTDIITLNGTTPVVTTTTWLGVNRSAIYLAGSGLTNAGTITITATTGGATQAQMPVGEGTTQQAIYFVQDNHQFLTDFLRLNVEKTGGGATPKCRIKGWVFSVVSNAKYLVFNELIDTSTQGFDSISPSQPFIIGEKSCLWFEATTDTNNTFVSARFSGVEFRDANS